MATLIVDEKTKEVLEVEEIKTATQTVIVKKGRPDKRYSEQTKQIEDAPQKEVEPVETVEQRLTRIEGKIDQLLGISKA